MKVWQRNWMIVTLMAGTCLVQASTGKPVYPGKTWAHREPGQVGLEVKRLQALSAYAGGSPGYSASKAYLNYFSQNLAWQLAGTGIKVQALCPGFTKTDFHYSIIEGTGDRPSTPAFLWMESEFVVERSLHALPTGRVVIVPGWQYKILTAISRLGLSGLIAGARRTITGQSKR